MPAALGPVSVEGLLSLGDPAAADRERAGSKAAMLARLRQSGFRVPDGHVITAELVATLDGGDERGLRAAVAWLSQHHGDARLAVRSSALAEDLAGASFAGQYDTVLDVAGPDELLEAVRRCSVSAARVDAGSYRARASTRASGTAVLVQTLVEPDLAGVALGADPLTGDRATVVVSATTGSGAGLVSGQRAGEDWTVTADGARPREAGAATMTAEQAGAVAELVRRVQHVLGGPPDIEWAIVGDDLFLLQARPMTALPRAVDWPVPPTGGWFRTIRLGELLPEPVTPLFASWLLERLARRFAERQSIVAGFAAPAPWHVLVHGWYYHSPLGAGRQTLLLRSLIRRPRLAIATLIASRWSVRADRMFFGALARDWPAEVLRPYRQRVAKAERRLPAAEPAEVVGLADDLADAAGDFSWSLVLFGGAAWRSEVALARFWHRHLSTVLDSYQVLLRGLADGPGPGAPAHAVHSIDWIRPTLGELATHHSDVAPGPDADTTVRPDAAPDPDAATHPGADPDADPDAAAGRWWALAAERSEAEAACLRALAAHPRRRARFATRLEVAQRLAAIRDEQGRWFTLGWPVMRAAVLRLGERLHGAGHLTEAEDVFFLERAEMVACLENRPPDGVAAAVTARRSTWDEQRRLSPPLVLGRPPFLLARMLLSTPRFLRPSQGSADTLHGTAASPGTATGPVRVLLDPTAVEDVQNGDVLVVSAAAPALTALFDRVVALCVDSGSVAAHASLVAREYGIPAVVGLGDATSRLRTGALVTVDGNAGTVHIR